MAFRRSWASLDGSKSEAGRTVPLGCAQKKIMGVSLEEQERIMGVSLEEQEKIMGVSLEEQERIMG